MAINYNELNDILSKIQKIKVDQLGDLNQRIKDFSKYREEQDQKMESFLIDCNNWKNKTQKETESLMKKHINESQTTINDMKQNIINMKGENTKWKNYLIEEQDQKMEGYLKKINQNLKENKERQENQSNKADQKLNEMKFYIKENIVLTNKKIENQTKELAKLAKKTKILQIFLYYIVGPMILLMIGFLIYSIKFIF